MAPKSKKSRATAQRFDTLTPAGSFVSLRLRGELLKPFGQSEVQVDHHIHRIKFHALAKELGIATAESPPEPPEMHTRGAWDRNLANPNRTLLSPRDGSQSLASRVHATNSRASPTNRLSGVSKPTGRRAPRSTAARRQRTATQASQPKKVSFSLPDALHDTDSSRESSAQPEADHETDKENEMADRPKLKIRLNSVSTAPPPQTPNSETARTPSIKLKLGRNSIDGTVKPQVESPEPVASDSSAKKRKRRSVAINAPPIRAPPAPVRKLTLTTSKKSTTPATPAITPGGFKLKAKGKIPKRALGVGYDSELDEREADPVILEGFILRMQPGPDCDYVRTAIENGTIGLSRMQGGADVKMRFLDTQGRRGILYVRGNQYATSMVDLPCIIEGMKSWDKKGFIKSIDICQMMLVLGRCKDDDEARTYPLPDDVDPHNYQYAHGITAPMKWVRKRRFARTKRVRVDDIEAVDRRVNALLDADAAAQSAEFEVLDHDPRLEEPQYSGTDEEEDEEDEDEEDAEAEPDDYFATQNGANGVDETPGYAETPQEEIADDEVDEFERMLAEHEDDAGQNGLPTQDSAHLAPEAGGSSFAVTSTSASPSAAAAETPASAGATSDDDEDDDDDEKDEEQKDDDENVQQVKERIQDLEERIKEQTETLKKTNNTILRRKIAGKIGELKSDVKMMKRSIGLGVESDSEEE